MVNGHISPQTRAGAYFRIFPNEAACADNYVIAQHYAGFDNRVGADGNVATQLRRRIDDRARRDILSRLRRGIKNLSHARVGQVGVTHYQRGAMGKGKSSCVITTAEARQAAVLTVLRVDHESDLARFRALHGRNAGDDDIAITV